MANKSPVKLAYKEYNPIGGADNTLSPIIFLHGMGGTKDTWGNEPQKAADQTKRKTYAIDARNHGDSEYTEDFHFDLNIVDFLHFMDTLHIKKAILIGQSMGGYTSIRTALTKPERVEKILTIDIGIKKLTKEVLDTVTGFMKLWLMILEEVPKDIEEDKVVDFLLDLLYSKLPPNTTMLPPKENFRVIGNLIKRNPDGKYDVRYNKKAVLGALQNYENIQSDTTGVFEGPALFVYGEKSPFNVGKDKENIMKHFPKAEFVGIDCGHAVNIEQPEKFIETMLEFLCN